MRPPVTPLRSVSTVTAMTEAIELETMPVGVSMQSMGVVFPPPLEPARPPVPVPADPAPLEPPEPSPPAPLAGAPDDAGIPATEPPLPPPAPPVDDDMPPDDDGAPLVPAP